MKFVPLFLSALLVFVASTEALSAQSDQTEPTSNEAAAESTATQEIGGREQLILILAENDLTPILVEYVDMSEHELQQILQRLSNFNQRSS